MGEQRSDARGHAQASLCHEHQNCRKKLFDLGNSGKFWVSVFHVRGFGKVEGIYGRSYSIETL